MFRRFSVNPFKSAFLSAALIGAAITVSSAQDFSTSLFSALKWRMIGPFRAGRVTAVAGSPGDSKTFYFGTPGGGIWKTTNAGQVWRPIFDSVHVASIGALAVAP